MVSIRSRVFGVANPGKSGSSPAPTRSTSSIASRFPILPLLVTDFDISYGAAGALLTVFFVTYSVFQLPAGMLADRIGQRWLLAAGMVVLSGGFLLAASAQGIEMVVVAQALGGSAGAPPTRPACRSSATWSMGKRRARPRASTDSEASSARSPSCSSAGFERVGKT
jgi:MFS family permease